MIFSFPCPSLKRTKKNTKTIQNNSASDYKAGP